ncbi:MAG: hypothetical protein V1896_01445 [Candidatus Zambryskibacteria bacterium]
MPICKECNDTGVIETGNNDIPCICVAGDTASFNVAGEGLLTGAQIKSRDALPQMPTMFGNRRENDVDFEWDNESGCWWSINEQQEVKVIPPASPNESQEWTILVVETGEGFSFSGHRAEKRAFGAATVFAKSK